MEEPGLHPPGHERKHPPRRVPVAKRDHPRLNIPAIEAVQSVYERGVTEGVFRAGLDPVDLHMSISALSFFNVANQHTFSLIFDRQVDIDARARDSAEMLVRFVKR